MSFQSPRSPNRDNFGTPPWESRDKKPFGCRSRGQTHRILYGGRWWHPLSPGRDESSESVLPVAYPNTIFPFKKINRLHSGWARLALKAITLEPPFPILDLGQSLE